MDRAKRKAIEAAGFRFGDASDFLELTDGERKLVELRLNVARMSRQLRERSNLTQKQVATWIKSTQPRVARIEAASPDVSLDQMLSEYFAVGGNIKDLVPRRVRNPGHSIVSQTLPEAGRLAKKASASGRNRKGEAG